MRCKTNIFSGLMKTIALIFHEVMILLVFEIQMLQLEVAVVFETYHIIILYNDLLFLLSKF